MISEVLQRLLRGDVTNAISCLADEDDYFNLMNDWVRLKKDRELCAMCESEYRPKAAAITRKVINSQKEKGELKEPRS